MAVGSAEEEVKSGKKHKEKEEMTKIVLRRLPPGIGPAELLEQFAPLPTEEPHDFWFCAAPGCAAVNNSQTESGAKDSDEAATTASVDDADEMATTLRRARCAFGRAYLVFREEKNALSFAERFNGYVFVDKNGIESMAIVELAPNQTVPKRSIKTAIQSDERVNTLTNDVSFLKFMKRREAAKAAVDADGGARRVTDFDELVRQLEEKQRRFNEGQVQETPLTEFIRRLALEKARKPRLRRSALAAASEMVAIEQSAKEQKTIKGRKMAEGEEDKTSATQKGSERTKTRRERRRRKEQKEKTDEKKKKEAVVAGDDGKTSTEAKSSIRIKTRKSRRQGSDGTNAVALGVAQPLASATKSAAASKDSKRNKDRPEREIYRPGHRKTSAAATKTANQNE